MGKSTTLLEGLCGHALALGAESIEVEFKDGRDWVFANKGGIGIGIANYASPGAGSVATFKLYQEFRRQCCPLTVPVRNPHGS